MSRSGAFGKDVPVRRRRQQREPPDASAIVATIDPDAPEHAEWVEILGRIQRPMLVSNMVVAETDSSALVSTAAPAYRICPSP